MKKNTVGGMYMSAHHPHSNDSQGESVHERLSKSFLQTTSLSVSGYDVRLPAISQPLLSRYRGEKLKVDLFSTKQWNTNIFIDFFCGKQSHSTISMCQKCQPSQHSNLCSYILQIVEQQYDWKKDPKFKTTYQSYNRKKIPIFLTDHQIQNRLTSKFNILGVVLLENHKQLLMRIIKNFIKHTIYYGEQKKLSLQNDYYFWFLVGIYYHVGVPKYFNDLEHLPKQLIGIHEPIMFWLLQRVMSRLGLCTEENVDKVSLNTVQYSRFFYPKQCKTLSLYGISLQDVFREWVNEGMMGYMGIEFIGFYIKCILKEGFDYVQKTVMSYFQKRTIKLDKEEIISYSEDNKVNGLAGYRMMSEENRRIKKQQILKVLLDSNEEWPGIFFNTNVYDFKG